MKNSIYIWLRRLDTYTLISTLLLLLLSLFLVTSASSSLSNRIGASISYFANKQLYYILIGSFLLIILSFFSTDWTKRFCVIGFLISYIILSLVPIIGYEVKGAKRWINLGGFSLQPTEFIKPFFVIFVSWMLSIRKQNPNLKSKEIIFFIYITLSLLALKQPDLGSFILITVTFVSQLFISGIPLIYVTLSGFTTFVVIILAYLTMPHVANRMNIFLSNEVGYQVGKSLLAFKSGGIFGKGPGEGLIKKVLPDSHADFIFAVAGEELGAIGCTLIISLFAFIILRNAYILSKIQDEFRSVAILGIIVQLGIQSIINIYVSINLIPTKGTTLPMVSYGGSSILSVCISIGVLLSLNKTNIEITRYKLKQENFLT